MTGSERRGRQKEQTLPPAALAMSKKMPLLPPCPPSLLISPSLATHVECVGQDLVTLVVHLLVLKDEEHEADQAEDHELLDRLGTRNSMGRKR